MALVVVLAVAAIVFFPSLAYEIAVRSGWQVQELGYTPTGDGYYQLDWSSGGTLELAYLGVCGSRYALLHGERVDGEWNLSCLSPTAYEYEGTSFALDSKDNAYVCTCSYDVIYWAHLGPNILFATDESGEWDTEIVNITHLSGAGLAVDTQDKVHLIYSRDTHQRYDNPNSTIVDSVRTADGWNGTVLKESYTPYVFYYVEAVDERPDGSIGILYATHNWVSWYEPSWSRLNYSIISDGTMIYDYAIIPSYDNYSGRLSLCHDSSGNAHIATYRLVGEVYSLCYFTNANGPWASEDVAYGGNEKGFGTGVSITVDHRGSIYMGYFVEDYDGQVSNHSARYCTNAGGSWVVGVLDDNGGWYMEESIAVTVDDSDNLHAVFFQSTTSEHGDRPVTIYTTSARDPDRYEESVYISGTRAALLTFIATVAMTLLIRRRRNEERRQRWMDESQLYED